jgi:hypothetical protein
MRRPARLIKGGAAEAVKTSEPFWPKVWHALTSGRAPCGPGRYRPPAALAAAEALAGLGDVHAFGESVDVDVGLVAAGFARSAHGSDAGGPGLLRNGARP